MTNKLFLPAGATQTAVDVVTLSNGTKLPTWAFIAVPITTVKNPGTLKISTDVAQKLYVDAVTGALSTTQRAPVTDYNPGESYSGTYDFSNFSRSLDAQKFLRSVENALPVLIADTLADQVDPGFFEAVPSDLRSETPVSLTSGDFSDPAHYDLGYGYTLQSLLVQNNTPQVLADSTYGTALDAVLALEYVVTNVLTMINSTNEFIDANSAYTDAPLSFQVLSGYVESDNYAVDTTAHLGEAVTLSFPSGTFGSVYQKAIDMAIKLPFDAMYLDYSSVTSPQTITVVSKSGSQLKKIATRYDGVVVADGKFLNLSRNTDEVDVSVVGANTSAFDPGVTYNPGDDYSGIVTMITQNPNLFGGIQMATSILTQLGAGGNPFISAISQAVTSSGVGSASSVVPSVLSTIQSALTCPPASSSNPRNFPTASHPAHRSLSDVTQMDDTTTQDQLPFPIRANNPLKVKKIPGVTDLKELFGFLGEAEGFAVYRDHVGGAAAGLNYLKSMGGSTLGSVTKSILGAGTTSGFGDDITAMTPAKIFQNISQSIFGVGDPSGLLQECATVNPSSMESTVNYAAAVSTSVSGLSTSPLTHDEWASAYQIMKNTPNQSLQRNSTGAQLPVQEGQPSVATGSRTSSQGKETKNTTDTAQRGSAETFNPITNFDHFNTKWGSSGTNWIAAGLISYAQKSGAGDTSNKIAKASDTQQLSQVSTQRGDQTALEWDVPT